LGLGSKIFPTHLIAISLEGMDVNWAWTGWPNTRWF
jgi:hypothetical protein